MLTRMLVLDFRAKDVWKSGEMTSGHIPVVVFFVCVEFSKYLLIKILKFMRKKHRGN